MGRCHFPTSLAFTRSKCRNKDTCKVSFLHACYSQPLYLIFPEISASADMFPDETPPEACNGISHMNMATGETPASHSRVVLSSTCVLTRLHVCSRQVGWQKPLLSSAKPACFLLRDPAPLYSHDRGYMAGVTPHYLLLANRYAGCAGGRALPQTMREGQSSNAKRSLVRVSSLSRSHRVQLFCRTARGHGKVRR